MPEQSPQPKKPTGTSSNKTLIIVVAVLAALVLLGGGGYYLNQRAAEKSAEKAIEEATGGKADVDVSEGGDKVTIETDEGKLTIGKNEVPESFPSDLSIYPGAEVTGSFESEGNVTVALRTSDSISKVTNFYKSDLEKNGWKIISTSSVKETTVFTAEKGNNSVLISVGSDADEEDKTGVAIIVGPKA